MIAGIRPCFRSRRTTRVAVPLFFAGSLDSTAILTAPAINRLCLTSPRGRRRSEAEEGRARRDPTPAPPRNAPRNQKCGPADRASSDYAEAAGAVQEQCPTFPAG